MRYILPGVQFESEYPFDSFCAFKAEEHSELPLCTLTVQYAPFSPGKVLFTAKHKEIHVAAFSDGWLYLLADTEDYCLHVSRDYSRLVAYITDPMPRPEKLMPLIRMALECAGAAGGVISLHSACVLHGGKAVCFSAASGIGKSTRAQSWEKAFDDTIISGDRPSIRLTRDGAFAYGVPWDGKEQIYRNISAPLLGICHVRRSNTTRIRLLSRNQARRVLMQQCFLPMWDTELAAYILFLINRLCREVPVYRVLCGPDEDSARQVEDILFHHPNEIREIEKDMKIKNGFVLRSAMGEHIVMPTGRNISSFDGAIVLNEVSVFVWEKMQQSVSREELLGFVLDEFDVDREVASKDLDALLDKLGGYGVIEYEDA
ncbi:MAG: PqqD family peptide modification chaperone [Eubacteriales bacterium]